MMNNGNVTRRNYVHQDIIDLTGKIEIYERYDNDDDDYDDLMRR